MSALLQVVNNANVVPPTPGSSLEMEGRDGVAIGYKLGDHEDFVQYRFILSDYLLALGG